MHVLKKTTFAEGSGCYKELFRNSHPLKVLQCINRVLCAKNGDFDYMRRHGGSAVAYAWLVWRRGHTGPTILTGYKSH